MANERYLGAKQQGVDEQIPYGDAPTAVVSSPTSPTAVVYQVVGATYTDVTATVMPGAITVIGNVVQLPALKSLVDGGTYRVEVKFSIGTAVYEVWFEVQAER